MPWHFWMALAILLQSIGLISSKYLRTSISSRQLVFWQYTGSVITALFLYFALPISPINQPKFLLAILGGSIVAIGALSIFKAIGYSLSKTMAVFSFRSHFSTLLFILFLKEAVYFQPNNLSGILKLIALFSAGLAILLLSKKSNHKAPSNKAWLLPSLVAIFALGTYQFISKAIIKDLSPNQAILGQYLGSLSLTSLVVLFTKTKIFYHFKLILANLLRGFIFAFGWFFTYKALSLKAGSLTYLVIVLGNTIFPILYGLFFLNEKKSLSTKNLFGLIIGSISIILLAI